MNNATSDALDFLADSGWDQAERDRVRDALGIGLADVATWQGLEDEGKINRLENEFRTRFTACQMEGVIENRAVISNPAILNMPDEDLDHAINYAEETARELFEQMVGIERKVTPHSDSSEWCQLKAKFEAWSFYHWSVARRAGLV